MKNWRDKFDNKFLNHSSCNNESCVCNNAYYLKQFITDIRKSDEEELIKMLPKILKEFDEKYCSFKLCNQVSKLELDRLKCFLSKAIAQTREETIREVKTCLPSPAFLNGLGKASYNEVETEAFKNGVYQTYVRIKEYLDTLNKLKK